MEPNEPNQDNQTPNPNTPPSSPQPKSSKGLIILLVTLVIIFASTTAYLATKDYQYSKQPHTQNQEATPVPTKLSSLTPTATSNTRIGSHSPITEEDDWGYITVKKIGNEINAMTPARYTFTNLPTTINVSKYTEEESTCPELNYRLQDNENYTLFLLLPHTGLRPSTQQAEEIVTLNGQVFTKTSHFTDNTITAIYYKSEPLTINHNNTSLEYTWDAYLTADTDIGIDEPTISAAETVIGQLEIQEINDTELSICQIKQQNQ